MNRQDFYTVKEVAESQRVTARQIQKLCKTGVIPYYQDCPGGKILISHDDYLSWLLSKRKI